jgi:spermidine/putrescine transport system substrate-binding protein
MGVSGYTSAVATPEIAEAQIDSTLTETVNLNYFFGPGHGSMKVNSVQYPDSAEISRCVLLHDFLDKNDAVLEMWSRMKGDSLNTGMAILILGTFSVIAAWLISLRVAKYRSKRRRLRRYSNDKPKPAVASDF